MWSANSSSCRALAATSAPCFTYLSFARIRHDDLGCGLVTLASLNLLVPGPLVCGWPCAGRGLRGGEEVQDLEELMLQGALMLQDPEVLLFGRPSEPPGAPGRLGGPVTEASGGAMAWVCRMSQSWMRGKVGSVQDRGCSKSHKRGKASWGTAAPATETRRGQRGRSLLTQNRLCLQDQ